MKSNEQSKKLESSLNFKEELDIEPIDLADLEQNFDVQIKE